MGDITFTRRRPVSQTAESRLKLKCKTCQCYIDGRPVEYPNTPEERQTWRDCTKRCRIDATTTACRHYKIGRK